MPSESTSTSDTFTPKIYHKDKDRSVRFKDPTLSIVVDALRLRCFQLVTVAGAAALAKTTVAPLERVKILMQVEGMRHNRRHHRELKLPGASAWTYLQHIVRQNGWRGLYRGNGSNVLRLAPEVMLKFGIHDQLRVIFGATDSTQLSFGSKLAAGSATGLIRTVLLHPLSVVRTRMTADISPHRLYRGIADCAIQTWRKERLRGLYGGFSMAALSSVPYLAVCFAMYDGLSELLPKDKHSTHEWWYPVAKMGAAAGAGITAQLVAYPLDTIRRWMEVNGGTGFAKSRNTLECVRYILEKEGVRALYRGCLVNAVKTVPSIAIQFVAHDALKMTMMLIDPATAATGRL